MVDFNKINSPITIARQQVANNTDKLSLSDRITASQLDAASQLENDVRNMALKIHQNTSEIQQLNAISSKLKALQYKSVEDLGNEAQKIASENGITNNWQVTGNTYPKTIQLDNNYQLKIYDHSNQWEIYDGMGNSTRIWGDPHVDEGDGKKWDFHADSTFVLPDGTKISVKTDPGTRTDGQVYSETLTITKGHKSLVVSGLSTNNPVIGEPSMNGLILDKKTNDGHIFMAGDDVTDWFQNGTEIAAGSYIKGGVSYELEQKNEDLRLGSSQMNTTPNLLQTTLTEDELELLKKYNVTVYDASGFGLQTPEELQNTLDQISGAQESLKSISNLDMVKLQAESNKMQQYYSLASQSMKTFFNTAREIIRNT